MKTLRTNFWVRRFYDFTRISMGLTFIASGLRKLPGVRFTTLSVENPVGYYFDAMYETGFYWNFIGYVQIVIGLMIFFRRFFLISPILMMPITLNIFLISISLHMQGTPMITGAMLLANTFLLIYHYEHYLSLFEKPPKIGL